MLNKILVFGGLAIIAVLIIENMVVPGAAFIFWFSSKGFILSIISTIVGIIIGFGIKGMLNGDNDDDNNEDLDF